MKHPSEQDLALYAGGDLGRFDALRTGWHIRRCETCRAEAARYQIASSVVTDAASALPSGWDRIAREMTGNIRVGLAAGACVTPAGAARGAAAWKPAILLASATAVLITAWWMRVPEKKLDPSAGASVRVEQPTLQATQSGIEVRASAGTLTLLHPRATANTVYVSAPNSLRVRYVDADTGQVTINNVYTE